MSLSSSFECQPSSITAYNSEDRTNRLPFLVNRSHQRQLRLVMVSKESNNDRLALIWMVTYIVDVFSSDEVHYGL